MVVVHMEAEVMENPETRVKAVFQLGKQSKF